MFRGTTVDDNNRPEDDEDRDIDQDPQDYESEWQKGNDRQVDMSHLDGLYCRRDEYERIAFAASTHWRKDMIKR
jgi:hypothetical protein